MKKLGVLLFLSMLFISCGKEKIIDASMLQQRKEIVYEANQKKPFTGTSVKINSDIIRKTKYKKGIKEVEAEFFEKNGQVYKITKYKNGKKDGLILTYKINGEIIKEETYKNGILTELTSMDYNTGVIKKREIFEEIKFTQFDEELTFKKITLKYNSKGQVIHLFAGDVNIPVYNFPKSIDGLNLIEQTNYTHHTFKAYGNRNNAANNYFGYEYSNGQWIAYMNSLDEYPVEEYQNGEELIEIYHYSPVSKPIKDSIINVKSREKIIESLKKITAKKFWAD